MMNINERNFCSLCSHNMHSYIKCNNFRCQGDIECKKKKRMHYVEELICNSALKKAKQVIETKNHKLRALRVKNFRMSKKINELNKLIERLRETQAKDNKVNKPEKPIPRKCKLLMEQIMNGGGRGTRYPKELKSFAMTLAVYSPKAYDFVRESFDKGLPTRKSIKKLFKSTTNESSELCTAELDALMLNVEVFKGEITESSYHQGIS